MGTLAVPEQVNLKMDGIDKEAVLRYLGLNPNDIATQTLLLIAERYGLDPIRKHVVLIEGKGNKPATPYVTRDGLLHVAHRSGHLDGIVVEGQGETDSHFTADVSVWRDDMSHPFRFVGRYPKVQHTKHGDKTVEFGPEMAVKCAEAMGLRRAFDVDVPTVEERWDSDLEQQDGPPEPSVPSVGPTRLADLNRRIHELPPDLREVVAEYARSTGATGLHVTEDQYAQIVDHLEGVEGLVDAADVEHGE